MSWFRKKINLPKGQTVEPDRSAEALLESERKLRESRLARLEVEKVTRKARELVNKNDHFSEALERAMRRNNG